MRTPFLGSFYRSRSLNLDQQHCINLYLELAEHKRGKQKGMLLMTPGLDPLLTLSGSISAAPPTPPPVNATQLWVVGSSCELMQFPPNQTGEDEAPVIDITGTTSTLTGPQGDSKSFSYAVDIDPSGNQYMFIVNSTGLSTSQWSIPIFAPGATGNIAPVRNIVGSNTGFPSGSFSPNTAGICLDTSQNIYVGTVTVLNTTAKIISFPTGSNGNAVGTTLVTETDFMIASVSFDSLNNYIWACGNLHSNGQSQIRAYDLTGTLQRTITSAFLSVSTTQVNIGPAGKVCVAGLSGVNTVGAQVFANSASGAAVPLQQITVGSRYSNIGCVAMDQAGQLFCGNVDTGDGNSHVLRYGPGATDPATPVSDFWSNLFVTMLSGASTDATAYLVR